MKSYRMEAKIVIVLLALLNASFITAGTTTLKPTAEDPTFQLSFETGEIHNTANGGLAVEIPHGTVSEKTSHKKADELKGSARQKPTTEVPTFQLLFQTGEIHNTGNGGLAVEIPHRTIKETPAHKKDDAVRDVYWRSWKPKSKIPNDAVIGYYAQTKCGEEPVYMGQVYIPNTSGVQPTQISKHAKSVIASYDRQQIETNRFINILCAKDPEIFTWIHVNKTKDYEFEEDCVVAGYELHFSVYFGRTKHDGEVLIGKVKGETMYFPYIGEEKNARDFEVLCYKSALTRKRTPKKKAAIQITPYHYRTYPIPRVG